MSEITREEIMALTDAHTKSAAALEKVADRLSDIASKQDKLLDKLNNGMSAVIVKGVTDNYNTAHAGTIESLGKIEKAITEALPKTIDDKLKNCDMAKNVERAAMFIGLVGIVIIVANVILRGINTPTISKVDTTKLMQLEKILESKSVETPQ